MANFYGTGRSNYVRVKDIAAAQESLKPFELEVHVHPMQTDALMVSNQDSGSLDLNGWSESGEELLMDWGDWCEEHLLEGQILVLNTTGAEKLRYISGYAAAYNHKGECAYVNLDEALDGAIKAKFGDVKYASPNYNEVI